LYFRFALSFRDVEEMLAMRRVARFGRRGDVAIWLKEISLKSMMEQILMRGFLVLITLASLVIGCSVQSSKTPNTPTSQNFSTNAKFGVNSASFVLSTAVATIEARPGVPGYSWLRIYFYSFPPAADDLTAIANGNVASMEAKWTKLAGKDNSYNTSHAVIQLLLDKDSKVWQVDMSIPGHSCTIAPFEPDVRSFLQEYQFDGGTTRLKSKGTHLCDMSVNNAPNVKFEWDVDLKTRAFAKK